MHQLDRVDGISSFLHDMSAFEAVSVDDRAALTIVVGNVYI
jgi:hypothetical protein